VNPSLNSLSLNRWFYRVWVFFFALILQSCSMAETFINNDSTASKKTFSEFIQWRMTKEKSPPRVQIEQSDDWRNLESSSANYAVWIGHATYLLNNGDLTIMTDPIFSERASPVAWAGPKRMIPPSIPLADLPPIDVVVISHNHYDHLDLPSLKALQQANPKVVILVPQGDKALLEGQGLQNVHQFRWWQNIRLGKTELTFTPVQHWSSRGITDRNSSLWGGWFIKSPSLSLYHAGDTGYSKDFVKTRETLGVPDVAFIPIGAYEPRWFMRTQHVNPAEAVQVALDLKAPRSFGMHWGTFILTDEPVKSPPEELKKALDDRGKASDFFTAPKPGEILSLRRK
jgi:N-acyl-phosphatidylethanolamine-hydrolysing phospholipase D